VPEELVTQELIELCLEEGKNDDGYVFTAMLEHAPRQFITAELVKLCLEAVDKERRNSKAKNFSEHVNGGLPENELFEYVKFIPAGLWSAELTEFCLQKVRNRGVELRHVPKECVTAQMCSDACQQDFRAIEYVPDNFKTAQMCAEAVKQDFLKMLKYVPENLMSVELEAVFIQKVKEKARTFDKIPDGLKTAAVCLEAVKGDSYMIKAVPENLRTPEVYLEAVKRDANILKETPDELKTALMCLEAVKNHPFLLRDCVPENLKTADVCLEAVKGRGELLEHVPVNLRTEEICFEAVKQDGRACDHVPENLRTGKILETAKANGYMVKVKAEEVNSMDAYLKILNDQMQNMPPEAREAMMKSMANMPPEVREAMMKNK
jgi:hypothetical protein